MTDSDYNQLLLAALLGKTVRPDAITLSQTGRPMFSFWGEEAGIPAGDIHATRAYRIYLDYNEAGTITGASVVIEGELISPCSGYRYEQLDQFDYEPVRSWCLARVTGPSEDTPDNQEQPHKDTGHCSCSR